MQGNAHCPGTSVCKDIKLKSANFSCLLAKLLSKKKAELRKTTVYLAFYVKVVVIIAIIIAINCLSIFTLHTHLQYELEEAVLDHKTKSLPIKSKCELQYCSSCS